MKPLSPVILTVKTVRLNDWELSADGTYRSGNVVIRNDGGTGLRSNWRIYRREKSGRLTLVWPKSRPWGYGHPGQAKIGAAHLVKPQQEKT